MRTIDSSSSPITQFSLGGGGGGDGGGVSGGGQELRRCVFPDADLNNYYTSTRPWQPQRGGRTGSY